MAIELLAGDSFKFVGISPSHKPLWMDDKTGKTFEVVVEPYRGTFTAEQVITVSQIIQEAERNCGGN